MPDWVGTENDLYNRKSGPYDGLARGHLEEIRMEAAAFGDKELESEATRLLERLQISQN